MESERVRSNERRRARRSEWFEGKVCVKCGSSSDLELDHIDPRLKISNSIWTWSWERILAEVAKCQVLCEGCHRVKTRSQLPITNGCIAFRHGTPTMYNKHRCRCGLCRLQHRNRRRAQRAASGS
ncbi:hypothetical protein UI24_16625 [Mycobacteroides franklinii]|nr:hypothetical protein [Mycobacteroides franklinii]